mmetsp:Transcript_39370/g.70882  ORF Transcript_39370/g.70882 Transcript_39370/m.70882 type:complete len:1285 (+) Transcript_39370:209-4063(+)
MVAPTSVDGGIEMPSYNIRHSIANKVAAKKTAKGYTLSDESCASCEMPLMTLNGKSECKVCPAIKKWVQRKNESNNAIADARREVDDVREMVETVEEEDAEIRDESPPDSPVDGDEKYGYEKYGDEAPTPDSVDGDDKYDDEKYSDEKYSDESPPDSLDSDEKSDVEVEDSDERSELEIESNDDSESIAERSEVDMKVSETESGDTEDDDDRYLSKSGSDESDDTDAIRARARQIIMDARGGGGGGWGSGSNDSDGFKSPNLSWDDERMTYSRESIEESLIQERAGEIINQARKNLQVEHGLEFPPEMIDTPRVELVDEESPPVHVDEERSASLEEFSPEMGTLEAATIIQSIARRFLARSLFLRMMYMESQEYHQDKEVEEEEVEKEIIEETATEQKTSLEHFKPLGVNTATEDDDKDWENAPVEVEGPSNVQEQQDEDWRNKEDVAQDVAQDGAQDDAPDMVDFDNNQDAANPNSIEKDICIIANGQESEPIAQGAPKLSPLAVSMSDYAAVLQNELIEQKQLDVLTPTTVGGPSRGLFAHLACKFDDAVMDAIGKVHSIVTCNMTGDDAGFEANGFGEAFEAEQNELAATSNDLVATSSNTGQVKYDALLPTSSGRAKYDAQVMLLTMRGWRVANASCVRCNNSLMILPEDGQVMCAGCDDIQGEPEPMAVPPHPESVVNHAPSHPEHFVNHAPPHTEYVANHAPPRPEHVVNHVPRHQEPNVQHAVQSQEHVVNHDCAPPCAVPSQEHIVNYAPSRSESVVNLPPRQEPAVSHVVPSQEPAVYHAPPRPEHAVNHAPPRPESVVANHAAPSQLYSIEMNRRLQMGWLAINHGCPYCNSQLMRKPNDNMDHCLACGPIFAQPTHTNVTPSMPTHTSYTPLGSRQSNVHQNTNTNPLRDVAAAHYGAAADQTKSTVMPLMPRPMPTDQAYPTPTAYSQAPPPPHSAQNYHAREERAPTPRQHGVIAPNQVEMMQNAHIHMMQTASTPTQVQMMQKAHNHMIQTASTPNQVQMMQRAHNHMMQNASTSNQAHMMKDARSLMMQMQQRNITPNHNQMMQMMQIAPRDEWAQADEAKENASGGANVSKQLDDAKLRIEDAKKFIMSRSSRRTMTPSSSVSMIHNMPPGHTGTQASTFRPQMRMSPSHGNIQPMMSHGNIQPMMSHGSIQPMMSHGNTQPMIRNMIPGHPGAQANIFRPQMNMMSAGSQAGTPQVMRQMGSLISDGEETNNVHSAQMSAAGAHVAQMSIMTPGTQTSAPIAQMSATPGSQHDGFLTPEMPGRYFFA